MAGSVNKALIVGNLGRDPEVRHTQSGDPICHLNVATSETWKKDGQKHERVDWHRVVIFNKHLAGVAEKYLHKGSKVYVEGQLQTRKWTDQQGVEKYTTEIVLQNYRGELQLLDKPPEVNDPAQQGPQRDPGGGDFDDEIPFGPCR